MLSFPHRSGLRLICYFLLLLPSSTICSWKKVQFYFSSKLTPGDLKNANAYMDQLLAEKYCTTAFIRGKEERFVRIMFQNLVQNELFKKNRFYSNYRIDPRVHEYITSVCPEAMRSVTQDLVAKVALNLYSKITEDNSIIEFEKERMIEWKSMIDIKPAIDDKLVQKLANDYYGIIPPEMSPEKRSIEHKDCADYIARKFIDFCDKKQFNDQSRVRLKIAMYLAVFPRLEIGDTGSVVKDGPSNGDNNNDVPSETQCYKILSSTLLWLIILVIAVILLIGTTYSILNEWFTNSSGVVDPEFKNLEIVGMPTTEFTLAPSKKTRSTEGWNRFGLFMFVALLVIGIGWWYKMNNSSSILKSHHKKTKKRKSSKSHRDKDKDLKHKVKGHEHNDKDSKHNVKGHEHNDKDLKHKVKGHEHNDKDSKHKVKGHENEDKEKHAQAGERSDKKRKDKKVVTKVTPTTDTKASSKDKVKVERTKRPNTTTTAVTSSQVTNKRRASSSKHIAKDPNGTRNKVK